MDAKRFSTKKNPNVTSTFQSSAINSTVHGNVTTNEDDSNLELDFTYNKYLQSCFLKSLVAEKSKEGATSMDNQIVHYKVLLNKLNNELDEDTHLRDVLTSIVKLLKAVDSFKEVLDASPTNKNDDLPVISNSLVIVLQRLMDIKPINGLISPGSSDEVDRLVKLLTEIKTTLTGTINAVGDFRGLNILTDKLKTLSDLCDSLSKKHENLLELKVTSELHVLTSASDMLQFINEETV